MCIRDRGNILENEKGGVNIFGKIISGLLFADDLVLVGKNQLELNRLKRLSQEFFEDHGLEINVKKSKEMLYSEEEQSQLHLWTKD